MSEQPSFTQDLLDRCISCGFCLSSCPTYDLTKRETSSPRGRIALMRALEDGRLSDEDPTLREESEFCLGCRACESVCPAGVQYGTLLEEWRERLWTPERRPLRLRALLLLVNRRWRVRLLGLARRHAHTWHRSRAERSRSGEPVFLMLGCFERMLFPSVSRSALKLVPDARAPAAQGCCGALHAHNGELQRGRELALALGEELPGVIVTTSGGCAAHLSSVLGRERVCELSEWLAKNGDGEPERPDPAPSDTAKPPRRPRVALQDSCHLRNGMGVSQEPRDLLREVAEYVELESAARCCGAAGSYAILRKADSNAVLDAKLDEIAALDLDYVVTVNPGCLRQLQQGLHRRHLRTRAIHIADFLAKAQAR